MVKIIIIYSERVFLTYWIVEIRKPKYVMKPFTIKVESLSKLVIT